MTNCPSCGFENPGGIKFCGNCAHPMYRDCSHCGFQNPPAFKFCGECGAEIRGLGVKGLAVRGTSETLTPNPSTPNPLSSTPKHLAEKILNNRAALAGERKQVTVLFADVKGSME